jgi:hypothetical protein
MARPSAPEPGAGIAPQHCRWLGAALPGPLGHPRPMLFHGRLAFLVGLHRTHPFPMFLALLRRHQRPPWRDIGSGLSTWMVTAHPCRRTPSGWRTGRRLRGLGSARLPAGRSGSLLGRKRTGSKPGEQDPNRQVNQAHRNHLLNVFVPTRHGSCVARSQCDSSNAVPRNSGTGSRSRCARVISHFAYPPSDTAHPAQDAENPATKRKAVSAQAPMRPGSGRSSPRRDG